MRKNLLSSIALTLTAMMGVASAATVTVTVKDNGVSNIGASGTFYWALTNCSPGDTIAFNIPGAGPHFLLPPPSGFPLIYHKHGITIDGYTQPGAMANSNPIKAANNAQIKIVIDGRNNSPGNIHATSLDYSHFDGTLAMSDPPIDNTAMATEPNATSPGEYALVAIYRSTNVTIKGLAFLADNLGVVLGTSLAQAIYGIHVAHDYGLDTTIKDALEYPAGDSRGCHVAGCWFGVNPANPTTGGVTMCLNWINFPRHKGDDGPQPAGDLTKRPHLPNVGVTIGVAPGAANPRSEFNVIVGGMYHFGGEPLRLRASGNFVGIMPDGVTPYDMSTGPLASVWSTYIGSSVECGRYGENYASSPTAGKPMVIGTDGDGINDADEGNLWGPIGGAVGKASLTAHGPALIHWYRSGNNVYLIAGNTWGIGVDGRRFANSAFFMSGLYLDDSGDGKTKLIIGSDFASSRSAATIAAQANHFYNNWPLSAFGDPPTTDSGIVPFLEYENPNPNNASATTSPNAWVSLRGNVMVGNGLSPINYANGTGSLLTGFTNFFVSYLDTNSAIIPSLNAVSIFPNLLGTFAPGIAPFTNVIIDVYQLDPEGWANGQAFNLAELTDSATFTNGFPQGRKYLGSFPVPNTGSFIITNLPPIYGALTVTANYSQDPAGTPLGRTATSDFSNPGYLRTLSPGEPAANGLPPTTTTYFVDSPGNTNVSGVNTNGPSEPVNNNKVESLGISIAANGNVVIGWEDDAGDNPLLDFEAVWTLFDATGNLITPSTVQTYAQAPGEFITNKWLSYFRADGSAVGPGTSWGPKIKANLFGDGFGMGAVSYGLSENIAALAAWDDASSGDFPSVQLLNNNGSPLTILPGVTATYATHDAGDIRIADWEYLSNGNILIYSESRQQQDLVDLYAGVAPQEHCIFRILTPAGAVVKAETLASQFAGKANSWHGSGVTANGFALRFNTPTGVAVRMFDNNGNPTTGDLNLVTLTGHVEAGGGDRGDGAGFHGNGNDAYVAVCSFGSGAGAWVTVLNTNGTVRYSRNVTDDLLTVSSVGDLDAAINSAGEVVVAFGAKYDNDNPGKTVLGRRFTTAGDAVGSTFFISEVDRPAPDPLESLGLAENPRIAWRGNLVAVAWETSNDLSTLNRVVARRLFASSVTLPTLSITRTGNNVTLSWPALVTGFTLESAPAVTGPTWSPVPGVVNNSVTVSIAPGNQFYRLKQ